MQAELNAVTAADGRAGVIIIIASFIHIPNVLVK